MTYGEPYEKDVLSREIHDSAANEGLGTALEAG